MVATLIRLRWRLTLNALRRNVWAIVGTVFGVLYGLGLLGSAVVAAGALAFADPAVARLVLGGLGAVLVAGWALVPLLLTGVDSTLDPRAMAAWIAPSRRLAVGLAVAGVTGIPGIVTGVVLLLPVLTWALAGQVAAAVAAVVMAPVALATCVLLSRVVVIGLGVAGSRRGREIAGIVGFAVVMGVALAPTLISGLLESEGGQVAGLVDMASTAARVAGLTPLGWALAAPGYFAGGNLVLGVVLMAGALACVAVLAGAWQWVVVRVMTRPASTSSGKAHAYSLTRRRGAGHRAGVASSGGIAAGRDGADVAANLGLDPLPWQRRLSILLPSPAAAVTARCLRYWRTDPRYLVAGVSIVLTPVFIAIPIFLLPKDGDTALPSQMMLGAGPVFALMCCMSLANDLAVDSTALWQHVASGLRGWHDRLGRVVAASLWQLPVLVIMVLGSAWYAQAWYAAAAVFGVSVALLAGAHGWASVLSVLLPFETQTPDESPLKSKTSGMAFIGGLAQMASILVVVVAAAPVGAGLIAVAVTGAWSWGWLVLIAGLAWAVVLAALGCWWGGRLWDRRQVRVLTMIRSWPGHEAIR